MNPSNDRLLQRDLEATIIPAGDKATLPKGMLVTITHRLGGNFTVTCEWGLFRILGKDADALGEEIPQESAREVVKDLDHKGPPSDEAIWEQLKGVFDPEIPVNIVDLGLVYSMDIAEAEPEHFVVYVAITLTAPGCGMGPSIAEDAKSRILTVPGVADAKVEIVWDPPWTQDMISEVGKMELGLI